MKFKDWFNENYDDLMQWYQSIEPMLISNPAVKQELEQTGQVRIRTIQSIGYSEGEAALLAREFNKRYKNDATYYANQARQAAADKAAETDDYYYHVALKSNWARIRKQGLVPNSKPTMLNYQSHSAGKIFLSDKVSVPYWKERVEAHEQSNTDNPKGVVVLRIKKASVGPVEPDELGTTDSRKPSYFTRRAIPASEIELVG